jgi:hypothetical protein
LLAYERKFQLCRFQLGLSAFSLFAHTRHLTEASGAGKEPGIAARDLCGNGSTLEGGNLVENLGILREEEDWNPESPRSPETPSLFDRWAMWMCALYLIMYPSGFGRWWVSSLRCFLFLSFSGYAL